MRIVTGVSSDFKILVVVLSDMYIADYLSKSLKTVYLSLPF